MNYSEFIAAVSQRAGMETAEATSVTRATLETLADRMTSGQASAIAGELPRELRRHLHKTTNVRGAQFAEQFRFDEFCHRVGERSGLDDARAEVGVRAVLTTVAEAISEDEISGMRSQLPKEFWGLTRPGVPAEEVQKD